MLLLAVYGLWAAANTEEDKATGNALGLRGAVMEPPIALNDFSLPSTQDSDFTLSDYRGKVILLYFGYTSCPDICPTTLSELTRVYQELGNLTDKVQIVFVSSDPERDTLAHLREYLTGFNPNFIGLRGEGEPLQALAAQFYAVAAVHVFTGVEDTNEIMHTTSIMLIDPQGRWLARFPTGTPYQDIVHDVRVVLEQVGG